MAELTTVARPYAKAAFQFALDSGKLDDWSSMLGFVTQVVAEESVAAYLEGPTLTAEQRAAALTKLCSDNVDTDMNNFISLLSANDRLSALPSIAELYEELKAEQEKSVDVNIASAFPLSEAESKSFAAALEKKLNRQVNIEVEVDDSLIGGVIIRAGDMVIDGSVKGKLSQLAETVI